MSEIHKLKKTESHLISAQSKTQEDLSGCKQHKKFLDLLAISAGLKKAWPQKRKVDAGPADGVSAADVQRYGKKSTKKNDATFLTSVGNQPGQKKNKFTQEEADAQDLNAYTKEQMEANAAADA